jgi:hypothetical protein
MIITYHGAEFFRMSFGDTTLAFNPISKDSTLKQNRFGADVALISLEHPDMNGAEQVSHGEKQPFIIRGPGEYEVRDVLIKGYQTRSTYGGEERINTAYLVMLEKMLVLYLGAIDTKELPSELKEALDLIDILFVPIGGDGVLEADEAHELAVSIEPKLVIPMHFGMVGRKDALTLFLKEEGAAAQNHSPIDKLTLRSKDLEDKQNEVVVFTV